jgi:hypothetical protein
MGNWEETGLVMSAVLCEFEEFEYTAKRGPARQLNFLIEAQQPHSVTTSSREIEEPAPTLNPSEHQAYVWVGAADSLEELPMSGGMKTVVQNAPTTGLWLSASRGGVPYLGCCLFPGNDAYTRVPFSVQGSAKLEGFLIARCWHWQVWFN